MIQRVSHASIYVFDQDAARDFFVNKLGFDLRMDESGTDGFRWLTVSPKGQPDFQLMASSFFRRRPIASTASSAS
jgi:catechol 2,3-dioxygenase-like lactoylglutathione lyase family enzyme